jgi:hypothetical protein
VREQMDRNVYKEARVEKPEAKAVLDVTVVVMLL